MKHTSTLLWALVMLLTLAACGSKSKKENNATISGKKVELEKLKKANEKNDAAIKKLEDELALLDTANGKTGVAKLVAVQPVAIEDFKHFIELRGKVDADNISYVAPRGMGGQVKAIYVKQGQHVNKGQLLLRLDDAIARQQVAAIRQQTEGIKTQLALAKNVYERQKNLWDKGIGTEVQLLTSKSNVESLQAQLKSVQEQVKLASEQMNTANVYSDVSGIADIVNIKVGETFQGMTAAGPQIKIVNTNSLKVVTNIAENYITKLHVGSPVSIHIQDVDLNFNSTISFVGQSLDPNNFGFVAEAKIPASKSLKPNQTAIVRIQDYTANNAVVVPANTVQSDDKGKYVYVVQKLNDGKMVARRKDVNTGEVYADKMEIKTGLVAGEQIITEGYQTIYDGQQITTAAQ